MECQTVCVPLHVIAETFVGYLPMGGLFCWIYFSNGVCKQVLFISISILFPGFLVLLFFASMGLEVYILNVLVFKVFLLKFFSLSRFFSSFWHTWGTDSYLNYMYTGDSMVQNHSLDVSTIVNCKSGDAFIHSKSSSNFIAKKL